METIKKDIFTFLLGGSAGNGIKKIGSVVSNLFARLGRYVFEMEDYQSLIKGGHNFCVVSTSLDPIYSHYSKKDLIIALDERSYEKHKNEVSEDGIVIYNSDLVKNPMHGHIGVPFTSIARKYPNPELRLGIAGLSSLAVSIDLSKDALADIIKKEFKDVENNISFANEIYDILEGVLQKKFVVENGTKKLPVVSGNEAIPLGAYASGLDMFFAYPMTPASTILHFLASKSKDFNIGVVHPENEIAVINMALGASSVGLRTMVASSGGGFALMEEALSLAGMTETPILAVLSSRPGPSTGVPTYTEQGDLFFALNQGHGEFPKIVASPSTHEEAFYLAGELLNLAWIFQTVTILLTEKHLSESRKSFDVDLSKVQYVQIVDEGNSKDYLRYRLTDSGVSPLAFPPSNNVIKFSSYEHDEYGISTEDPEMISKMHEKRLRKYNAIVERLKCLKTVNVYNGSENSHKPVIFTYGSTTMSVLEAINYGRIDAEVVQPIYLEPFPVWALEHYRGRKMLVVEQSVMGSFARLLKEKMYFETISSIRKYDGRPFEVEELALEIKEALK